MKSTSESIMRNNSGSLEKELQWFEAVTGKCLEAYFQKQEGLEDFILDNLPDLDQDDSSYAELIKKCGFNWAERLLMCLALAPHLKPQLLDIFMTSNPLFEQPFTEFGGHRPAGYHGFLPTGETAAFLLTRGDLQKRFELMTLFSRDHPFAREEILYLQPDQENTPVLSGRLMVRERFLHQLSGGNEAQTIEKDTFPARRITTHLEWEDLVVSPYVLDEILQIKSWIEHEATLMQDAVFSKHVKPGYRSLFYGPPGTGKTMAASLLGKTCGLDVYRIDLSLIVSKYIGETEKNLAKVFRYAQRRNWILFFDEADALFGKRTETRSSNDRFANQEVAYLLQRIEDFPGVIILASNLKSNMDEAFSRRFQSTVFFPMPDRQLRLKLWENIFSGNTPLHPSCDLESLADKYELSGGSIINVLRYSRLKTIQNGLSAVTSEDIVDGIRREYQKNGRTV